MEAYTTSGMARTSVLRPVLLVAVLAFLLGGALVGYGLWRFGWPALLTPPQQEARSVAGAPAAQRAMSVPMNGAAVQQVGVDPSIDRVVEQQGGIEQRLAAAEQRLARLDLQAQAATGNAARAEGLLIAFAARRAVDRGTELGFLADQLRLRFGDALPNAVTTVIEGARQPVTVDQLTARLDGLAPQLSTRSRDFTFDTFREELSSLFVVRRDTTPSVQPAQRLERAKLFLRSGRISAAVEEVRLLPGAANARTWIADARRYAAMQNALDLIETSAVLEPRRLRDRNGTAVVQPAPADNGM